VEDIYELETDKIGQGTFGIVRRAKHRMTGIAKAVKVIEKSKVKDPRQLKREVANMRQLDHPHIVRLYETFEDATTVQLVLELCGGGELFHAITKVKRFPERETAIIMDQMLRAVHYMHTLHICHRDLKPENFLFMTTQPIEDNVLKLIDFGLSCRCKPPEVLREVVGTASYVAPQVLMRNYDKQCDLWSCGIIMYIMLCGHPPFRGKNQAELLLKVRDGSFVFDAKVWRTVTRGAKNLITMLLKRDPEERHTAERALTDPWLLAAAPKNSALLREAPLRDVLVQELRSFSAENRLKKAALHVISRQLSDEHTRELQDIFRALDADNDGMLSLHDLKEGLALWGVPEDIPDLELIMDGLDLDGTGYVDYTEFLAAAVDKERFLNKDICMCAFNIFDSDGDGKITNGDLRKVLDKGSFARDVAGRRDALVKDVARNGHGTIDFEDFMAMLTKPSGMSTAASEMGP
jgi:calcium-dependent protein kinase